MSARGTIAQLEDVGDEGAFLRADRRQRHLALLDQLLDRVAQRRLGVARAQAVAQARQQTFRLRRAVGVVHARLSMT
jgi:hypothetical protein